jgi:WD40 repeat protein
VTALQFVPNTHMFFTAGKDGKIKQWDADNFERILTLEGHANEVSPPLSVVSFCNKSRGQFLNLVFELLFQQFVPLFGEKFGVFL